VENIAVGREEAKEMHRQAILESLKRKRSGLGRDQHYKFHVVETISLNMVDDTSSDITIDHGYMSLDVLSAFLADNTGISKHINIKPKLVSGGKR